MKAGVRRKRTVNSGQWTEEQKEGLKPRDSRKSSLVLRSSFVVFLFLCTVHYPLSAAIAATHVTATYDLGTSPQVMTTVGGQPQYGLVFAQRNKTVTYNSVEFNPSVVKGYLNAGGQLNDGAGNLWLDLIPNLGATPADSYYVVTFNIQGRVHAEIWVLPDVASVSADAVRQSQPPSSTNSSLDLSLATGLLALAHGGTNQSAWTASRCVRVNDAGSGLESAAADCGTGGGSAPLASSTVSGTVKTDTNAADPVVYLKTSADTLLAAKAPAARTISTSSPLSGGGDLSADRTISCPTCEVNTNKNAASGYAGLTASTKLNAAQGQEVWSSSDLSDFASKSGSGTTILGATISSPASTHYLGWSGTNWINRALASGDLPTHTHAAGDVTSGSFGLARGGTSQTAWTASRCVRVNDAGTSLESAAGDCGTSGGGDNVSVNGTAATDADFDDSTPAAPANSINVKWQKDALTPNNVSARIPYAAPLTVTGGNLAVTSDVALYSNASKTWGAGSGFNWTFDAGAIDPVLEFSSANLKFSGATTYTFEGGATDPVLTPGNSELNLSTGTLKQGGNAVALVTNNLSVFSATTSAQLSGVLSDETGTGAFVLATSPTNLTLDAEATGNNFTDVSIVVLEAASCIGAVAANAWDDAGDGSTAPTAACNDTGAIQRPSADFSGSAVNTFERTIPLPTGWTGNIDLNIRYVSVAASPAGNVEWEIQTVCRAVGESWDAAFNAAQTITDAVGSQNSLNDATQASVTTTGCAAGEDLSLRVSRDGTNDSNNDLAKMLSAQLTARWTK